MMFKSFLFTIYYGYSYSGDNTDLARAAICKLDSDEGSCDSSNQRWHYNAARGTCVQFYWGGCGGNR